MTGTIAFVVLSLSISLIGGHGQFLIWLADHRTITADYYFYYATRLGEEYGFVAIGIFFLFRQWRKSLMIAVLGLTVTVVTYILKTIFQFQRPSLFLAEMGWEGPLAVLDYPVLAGYASFPSGHSMAAWALFTFMAALYRKPVVAIGCLFLAISVSMSRVYLMAHFLRDVAVGAAIGFAIGYLIYYVYDTRLKTR